MEWVVQVRCRLSAKISIAKDELLHHIYMFCPEFLGNRLAVKLVDCASCVQKIMESCASEELTLTRETSRPRLPEVLL